jgi:hypothetical protein
MAVADFYRGPASVDSTDAPFVLDGLVFDLSLLTLGACARGSR